MTPANVVALFITSLSLPIRSQPVPFPKGKDYLAAFQKLQQPLLCLLPSPGSSRTLNKQPQTNRVNIVDYVCLHISFRKAKFCIWKEWIFHGLVTQSIRISHVHEHSVVGCSLGNSKNKELPCIYMDTNELCYQFSLQYYTFMAYKSMATEYEYSMLDDRDGVTSWYMAGPWFRLPGGRAQDRSCCRAHPDRPFCRRACHRRGGHFRKRRHHLADVPHVTAVEGTFGSVPYWRRWRRGNNNALLHPGCIVGFWGRSRVRMAPLSTPFF
jgi:hypothetical protein